MRRPHVGLDFYRAAHAQRGVSSRLARGLAAHEGDVSFFTWSLDSNEATLQVGTFTIVASDHTALTKYTRFLELRWPTLATLALCTLLPGCPLNDDYFIWGSSAGAGQLLGAGGAYELSAGGALSVATGGVDAGGEQSCSCSSGGRGRDPDGNEHAGRSGSPIGHEAGSSSSEDAGSGNEAGSPSTSAGGTSGGGGSLPTAGTASGGAVGTAGSPSNLPQPACADGVIKSGACTLGTPACYKSCGPDNLGFKSETCQLGAYAESDCSFPTGQDYGCYKIPLGLSPKCPAGVPRGASPCSVSACTVCYGAGPGMTPQYQDSTGAQKPGYCVCSEAGTWTCGSTVSGSWPCPGGQGCN